MGMEHTLAKMTARSPSLEIGTGGIPELTGQDVAAALGYVYGRIPADRIGVHLVMAKYTDDNISIHVLEKTIPRLAWLLWFDLGLKNAIKPAHIQKIAKLAIYDFRDPAKFSGASAARFARFVGVDYRTWGKGMAQLYSALLDRLRDLESPIFFVLYHVLARDR